MAIAVILMIVLLVGSAWMALATDPSPFVGVDPPHPTLPPACTCPYATYNQQFERWETHVRATCPLHGDPDED